MNENIFNLNETIVIIIHVLRLDLDGDLITEDRFLILIFKDSMNDPKLCESNNGFNLFLLEEKKYKENEFPPNISAENLFCASILFIADFL